MVLSLDCPGEVGVRRRHSRDGAYVGLRLGSALNSQCAIVLRACSREMRCVYATFGGGQIQSLARGRQAVAVVPGLSVEFESQASQLSCSLASLSPQRLVRQTRRLPLVSGILVKVFRSAHLQSPLPLRAVVRPLTW
jgi:hypothetical protein